jgi:hypothetical protein
MLPVRPHITLIALIALALTLVLDRNTRFWTRAALLVVALAGVGTVGALVESSFSGLNLTKTDSVSEFIEARSNVGEDSGGDINITGASFPVKLVSLLFRPFFIDATGALGYVASLENAVLLIVILSLIWRFRTSLAVGRRTLFARFSFFFFVTLTILLAMVNYNVGLGLRQKMMVMPALLVFFATVLAVLEARRQAVRRPAPFAGVPMAPPGYRNAT